MGLTEFLPAYIISELHNKLFIANLDILVDILGNNRCMSNVLESMLYTNPGFIATFPHYILPVDLPTDLLQIIQQYIPCTIPLPPLTLSVRDWVRTKQKWDQMAIDQDTTDILIRNIDNFSRLYSIQTHHTYHELFEQYNYRS